MVIKSTRVKKRNQWRALVAVGVFLAVVTNATASELLEHHHEQLMSSVPPAADQQVTLANYMTYPYGAWGFSNSGAVGNSLHIARGGPLPTWSVNEKSTLAELMVELDDGRQLSVEALFADQDSDGVIVTRGSDILLERYAGHSNRQQPHIWYSMTKSLVSTAFGILVEQGSVELNRSPADYIPELKGSGFERVTIQQVLDHTTALDFKENYTDPDSAFFKFYGPALAMTYAPGGADAMPGKVDIYGVHDFLANYIGENPELQPGDAFEYNSANADLLGWLIARLSGQPLAEFIEQHIWQPLGSEHDAYILADRALQAVATGGMNTTLRDAALFGQLILNRGAAGGKQVVPASWVDASLQITDYHRRNMARNPTYTMVPFEAYHNMWWVIDGERGEYVAGGIFGQMIYIDRASGTVAAMYNHHRDASAASSVDTQSKLRALRAIARAVQ